MAMALQDRDPGDEQPLAEEDRVRDMRLHRLLEGGLEYEDAYLIAERPDIDWRLAVSMREQGCSSHMISNILL
jgi:hypothetical protein